jgi:hypothetical protein
MFLWPQFQKHANNTAFEQSFFSQRHERKPTGKVVKTENIANISLAAGEKCKIAAAFELFQEQEKGTNESFKDKKE